MEFKQIFEQLKPDLFRFARSIARHEQEADDLVQEAAVKAMAEENLGELPHYKQKAWFFRVMKNQMIDERRKEKRTTAWEDHLDETLPAATAGNHLEMVELLSSLPEELSDILFKRYWLGLSSQEIGSQLEMPAATVRYKLHTAVKKLRKKLEREG
ncbi:RNA polymerase sigma factor [Alteribacillus sp. HJP-4]|uniref:RNA polymerase sigma factor n=1 Tax=Alteribacillus sp. HJP-4 TaxID=2775394 RepID=UPI0035CCFDF4